MAALAWIGDYAASAAATRASLLNSKKALLYAHITLTMTGRADIGLAATTHTAAGALFAHFQRRHFDLNFCALNRLFEAKLQVVAQIRTAEHVRPATGAARENISEHIGEDIGE